MITNAKLNQEAVSIMERLPHKYPPGVYDTPYKRFKIILEELLNLGTVATIVTVRQPGKTIVPPIHYFYKYQVEINYEIVRVYRNRDSAKHRIIREYIKVKTHEASKEQNAGN